MNVKQLVPFTTPNMAYTAAAAAPKLTLSGGEPHHPKLASLWRDSRLTDIAVCAEGVECRAQPGYDSETAG